MRCLLTGGAGFVGSHLAEALLDLGHEVLVIDDLSTGRLENIQHLCRRPGFSCTIASVLNLQAMAELVNASDIVFHLAATVGVQLVLEDPISVLTTNIIGSHNLLELAAARMIPVLLFSSSEVYGKSRGGPLRETDDLVLGSPSVLRWSYAASKVADEFLALAYHRKRGLPVIVIRLFNTVGARQVHHHGMVLPRLVRQALLGEPLTVFGTGNQTRTFTHVADAVRATLRLMNNRDAIGEVFNVGGREEVSVARLANLVKEFLRSPSPVHYVPYDSAYGDGFEDVDRRVPDLAKIRRVVRFEPTHNLNDIIADVAAYQRHQLFSLGSARDDRQDSRAASSWSSRPELS